MAARFWVGGTGTWDAATTTNWSASSGGAGGASVPGASDDVTFDGSSGGGTVTVNFGGTITLLSLTMSAFTGTLDFATNNNSVTLTANNCFVNSGTATRTLNMGNGTWTLSSNSASFNQGTTTNLTFNANGSTIAFTGTGGTGVRRLLMGTSKTYNTVTVASGTSYFFMQGTTPTITTLTISPGNHIGFPSGGNLTVTNLTTISGSSSAQTLLISENPINGKATLTLTNAASVSWCGFSQMTLATSTLTATNSFDFTGNSGTLSITAPSVGGGGVVGVIGG